MWRVALPLEDVSLELSPRWSGLGMPPFASAALLIVIPLLLALLLSWYEMRLVPRVVACVLLALRTLLLTVLGFIVAFEPTIAHVRQEATPSEIIVAVDVSGSMDVVDPGRSDGRTRKDLVRKLLVDDGLAKALSERHRVKLLGFERQLFEADVLRPEQLFDAAKTQEHLGTNLNLPLARGTESAHELLGVVLLTDGQHNEGPSPLESAKKLDRPIYVVGVGPRTAPPDVAVVEMRTPDNAFKDTEVQVEARIRATGLPAQDFVVELLQKGKLASPEHRKTLKPGEQRVRFHVKLEELGTHTLEVRVTPTQAEPAEITRANNTMSRIVRVTHDRARVLMVDDEARWEFHYLANALMRDKTSKGEPTLQVQRVLLRQPRLGLLSEEDLEKTDNPLTKLPDLPKAGKGDDPLLQYDVILLGDVEASRLSAADRRRLEHYVAQRGGTLVMQAGKRSWPLDYPANDPFLKMVPITEAKTITPKTGFMLGLTPAGNERSFLQMETDPTKNQRFWSEMPKHFWGIVGQPRPGATVLAYATEASDFRSLNVGSLEQTEALIVLMPYGFGQVIQIGLDSTWRWRYRVGDDYHHHFWGQLVRWAAADRLLPAGNRFVRYGTRAPVYRQGKDVEVAVRLGDDAGVLPKEAKAAARIVHARPDGKEEHAALVTLQAKEHQKSVLEGRVRDLPPGQYRVELDIPELRDKLLARDDGHEPGLAAFTVVGGESGEMLDLSVNWELLGALAQESHGELFDIDHAGELVDRLARKITRREVYEKRQVWRDVPLVWWLLAVFLALLTTEWILRKGAGLP